MRKIFFITCCSLLMSAAGFTQTSDFASSSKNGTQVLNPSLRDNAEPVKVFMLNRTAKTLTTLQNVGLHSSSTEIHAPAPILNLTGNHMAQLETDTVIPVTLSRSKNLVGINTTNSTH